MKKVLYLTNIEVPYKVRFFNELSEYCDLTVLYERSSSSNRDSKWAVSEEIKYKAFYLDGFKIGNEFSFSFGVLKYVLGEYDDVIISCFNSPVQLMTSLVMRILKKSYYLSFDGEMFLEGKGLKTRLKRFFVFGAKKYLTAGEKSAESLRKIVGDKEVIPYYFSSMSMDEIEEHEQRQNEIVRGETLLVVGQYFDYKGMDIALEAAKIDSSIQYKFVGMGKRTELFLDEQGARECSNVQVIPFLQKKELEEEYMKAAMLVLPSRQECWGLVINEAASFGTPIVATEGSGAAVEFLQEGYEKYLAKAGEPKDLVEKIRYFLNEDSTEYSQYLIEKGKKYSVQAMVKAHCVALEM